MTDLFDNEDLEVSMLEASLIQIQALVTETVTEAISTGILISKLEAALRVHDYEYASITTQNPIIINLNFKQLTPKSCRIMNRFSQIVDA